MLRAVLAAVVCWATLGALGLPAAPVHAPAPDMPGAGLVSAPDAPRAPRVVEAQRLTWSATVERSAPGAERHAGRSVVAVVGGLHVARHPALSRYAHDTRRPSRMSSTAQRTIDLRREVFRIAPSRRAGNMEAAPAACALLS